MEKLKEILQKEYHVSHLTVDILDAFIKADEKAAKEFLIDLFKKDLCEFNEKDYSYIPEIPF